MVEWPVCARAYITQTHARHSASAEPHRLLVGAGVGVGVAAAIGGVAVVVVVVGVVVIF